MLNKAEIWESFPRQFERFLFFRNHVPPTHKEHSKCVFFCNFYTFVNLSSRIVEVLGSRIDQLRSPVKSISEHWSLRAILLGKSTYQLTENLTDSKIDVSSSLPKRNKAIYTDALRGSETFLPGPLQLSKFHPTVKKQLSSYLHVNLSLFVFSLN